MPVVRGADRPIQRRGHGWPPLQKLANHESGTSATAVWRNWVEPGQEVRLHRHDVEEIILVVRGRMRATLGGEAHLLDEGDALIVPPMVVHGFANPGPDDLAIVASFPSPAPQTLWEDEADTTGLHLDQLAARRPSAAP
jgi:quercetin dioxygenase-like cupin family protein